MSARSMLAIKTACERFEQNRNRLVLALERRESRLCLDALTECCLLWLEQTGGTLTTARFRGELTALSALASERPHLSIVPTPEPIKDPFAMKFEIETAAVCLVCSSPGLVYVAGDGKFEAVCSSCYDPTEGSSALAHASGHGETPAEAVAEWLDVQEENLPPRFWPTDSDWQLRVESARQAGWQKVGNFWGPPGSIAAE